MPHDWEENVVAGLESLDDEGHARVSCLGVLDEGPDEPAEVASALPAFEELELPGYPPRLA